MSFKFEVKERFFEVSDGKKLAMTSFRVENPKAVIQIVHGMAEHRKRYYNFAEFLVGCNFSVYILDQRGHGESAENESDLGFFAEKEGWNLLLSDLTIFSELINKENKNIPLILLGHSMGSILSRGFLFKNSKSLKAVILIGTNGDKGLIIKIAHLLAKSEVKKIGPKEKSFKFDKLMFGGFNKKIKNPKTGFDWLCCDEKQVDMYIKDPLCGFVCKSSMYSDLIGGLLFASEKKKIKTIQKGLPILFVSGSDDPVGKMGKAVLSCAKVYKKQGLNDVTVKLFQNGRHEILNEVNNEDVYSQICSWIETKLNKRN